MANDGYRHGDAEGEKVPACVKRPDAGDGTAVDMEAKWPERCADVVADRRESVDKTVRKRRSVECCGLPSGDMRLRIGGDGGRNGCNGKEQ